MKRKIRKHKKSACEMSREAGGGMEEVRKKQAEGGRAGEVVKCERKRDGRGGSYAVVHRIAYTNLTQGRFLNANLGYFRP